jgi:Ca2+-binding EF-hand superfamily protein
MNVSNRVTASVLCLATALLVANLAQAQSTSAKSAAAATPNQPATPDAIFAHWDKDKNKSLSLEEFSAGWKEVQMTASLRKLHANFVAMDANKSGSLEASEYANLELVKKSGSSAPQMSTFDADKNQRLDFKEYVSLVGALAKKQ